MKKTAAGLALAGLMLAGCVPSLNPLYTAEDLVFEPKLVGVWAEKEDSEERWTFEKAGETAYRVVYEDEDEKRGVFEVHLLRLGENLYLDFFPDDEAMKNLDGNDLYKFHWLPAHTFARVFRVEPELEMAFMNPDWLDKELEADAKLIDHVRRGDNLVLTASTKALQEFVREHADVAFGDKEPSKLRRIKPGQ